MADDKPAAPAGKKKNTRNAVIIGVVALGAGVVYFVVKSRGSSAANTSASTGTGSAASPGTDMGDIVQTVQGPPGPQGPPGGVGPIIHDPPRKKKATGKGTVKAPPAKKPTRRSGPVRRRKAAAK